MINGFAQGLRAYFEAYQILSRLRLWKYFVIPIVLSVIIFNERKFKLSGFNPEKELIEFEH